MRPLSVAESRLELLPAAADINPLLNKGLLISRNKKGLLLRPFKCTGEQT